MILKSPLYLQEPGEDALGTSLVKLLFLVQKLPRYESCDLSEPVTHVASPGPFPLSFVEKSLSFLSHGAFTFMSNFRKPALFCLSFLEERKKKKTSEFVSFPYYFDV